MAVGDVRLQRQGFAILLDAMLADLNVYVRLYTNDPPDSDLLTPGSFVEPVYVGYSPLPVKHWSPSALRGAVAVAVADPPLFTFTSGPEPLPIRGYFATDGPGGNLLWSWRKPGAPFPLGGAQPQLLVAVRVIFPAPC